MKMSSSFYAATRIRASIGLNYPPKRVVLEGTLNDDDFRVGVGGDFDADGRDEIAIASDEQNPDLYGN